jgi:serine/threonine protein kinase
MINEVEILQECIHPHVMNVYEILHDKNNFYVISELCKGGDLFDRIAKVDLNE